MSYYTEKTLSSIRSLIDEWSIRKEGGKQSFFVLKEIDKLLADTPVDDVVSSKDVADKKNEVMMLRLERDEMLIRRQLAERQSELDDTSPIERSVIGNLRSINTRQHTQIREHCETIGALGATIRELEERDALKTTAIDELQKTIEEMKSKVEPPNLAVMVLLHNLNAKTEALEAELSDRKEDSMVLMKVVKAVDTWHRCMIPTSLTGCTDLIKVLDDVLEDYSNTPEGLVVTLETPSIGTRVVSKNEETHMLVGSDMWVLHTDEAAVEDKQQKETIDELTETTRKLEGRLSSMYAANSDQDTTINKLNALLADEKMTLAAYRNNPLSDQVADRDNRIEQLVVLNEALRVDIDDHIAVQDRIIDGLEETLKLERIDHTAEHPACDCFSTALDEITKIIQEE